MTQEPGWPGISDEELLVAVANTGHGEHGEHGELTDPPAVRRWCDMAACGNRARSARVRRHGTEATS